MFFFTNITQMSNLVYYIIEHCFLYKLLVITNADNIIQCSQIITSQHTSKTSWHNIKASTKKNDNSSICYMHNNYQFHNG